MQEDILQKELHELYRREVILRIQALATTILMMDSAFSIEKLEEIMEFLSDSWSRRGPD